MSLVILRCHTFPALRRSGESPAFLPFGPPFGCPLHNPSLRPFIDKELAFLREKDTEAGLLCQGDFIAIGGVSKQSTIRERCADNRIDVFSKGDRVKNNIERFHDRGILEDGGIIFGFDTDTRTFSTGPSTYWKRSRATALPSIFSSIIRGPNSTRNLKGKAESSVPTTRNTPAARSS